MVMFVLKKEQLARHVSLHDCSDSDTSYVQPNIQMSGSTGQLSNKQSE
jgi:hypothetical protein